MINNVLEPPPLELPDLLHYDIDVEDSEPIHHSHALDDVKVRLSPKIEFQNERERNQRE